MLNEEILKSFEGKSILVTGGTGLIGRQVIHILCDAGAEVLVASMDNFTVDDRAKHIKADLCDLSVCLDITSKDYVFHLAGVKGSAEVTKTKPASFLVPLLMMNTNVLEACRINGVRKVVYTSSVGAYVNAEVFREDENLEGPPMDTYPGWAKRMAELQIKAYKVQYGLTNFAIVRPTNVYGPGDNFDPANAMVIPSLIARIFAGENPLVVWGDGTAIRDFAYSKDVAKGIIQALYYGTDGFVNLGGGRGYTIRELVEALAHIYTERRRLPFGYRFDASKPRGFPKRVMDITKARKMLNYNPTTTLQEGLKLTWDWFVEHNDEYLQKRNYFND